MKVRVRVLDDRTVSVHAAPSWWERLLFGRAEIDDVAVSVPGIDRGHYWLWESRTKNVRIRSRPILDAIEREVARAAAEQRQAQQQRR